jgi:hypothetical protein
MLVRILAYNESTIRHHREEPVMRHRLYYLLPDVESARRTFDDMLLSRIEQRHIHFMTGGQSLPGDLPEATFFQKTDVVHGAQSGMMVGALLGMAVGALVVYYFELTPKSAEAWLVVLTTIGGLLFGGWAASMAAAALPNSRLEKFAPDLEKGKVLMIADIPARRVEEIEAVLAERHPETRFSGEEPNIPAFP